NPHPVGPAELPRKRQPILSGQVQVHKHNVDLVFRHDFSHAVAVAGDKHFEATELEIFPQRLANFLLIVDDEDSALIARHTHVLSTSYPNRLRLGYLEPASLRPLASPPSIVLAFHPGAQLLETADAGRRPARRAFRDTAHSCDSGTTGFLLKACRR